MKRGNPAQHQKKSNPFKVHHVRSIRLKKKAQPQPFKGHLKRLSDIVRSSVDRSDEALQSLKEVVRQQVPAAPRTDHHQGQEAAPPTDHHQGQATPPTDHHQGQAAAARTDHHQSQAAEEYRRTESDAAEALSRLENWTCHK